MEILHLLKVQLGTVQMQMNKAELLSEAAKKCPVNELSRKDLTEFPQLLHT
jgi:ferredoxin